MFLRRLVFVSCLLSSALVLAQTVAPNPEAKHAESAGGSSHSPSAELPVRRVVLYKNGVGYFEHQGRVTGNQSLTIDFTSSQLDDALQSLTALDLNGGRIAGVSYNSTTPLDQQLKNIPLGLGQKPTTTDLYESLRGTRVEITGAGESVSGRIVHYELRSEKTPAGDTANHRVLTLVTDAGAIRSLEITPAVGVRIVDGDLRRDLDDYLALLASTQSRQIRHLTLDAQGSGTRDIHVSYITEVPVWKSTYRIVFPPASTKSASGSSETAILQGWAVVDNTVGSDWDNVQLSLVAGAPQSFIEPLSQPIYTTRPTVAVPEAENVAPVIHEGAVDKKSESVTVNADQIQNMPLHGEMSGAMKVLPGAVRIPRDMAGGMINGLAAPAPPPPPVQDESAATTSTHFDDFFEYTVAQPVTLHKNKSALVPFLQTNVQAERVTLWNADNPAPLRALWLTNSSSLILDRGSFSVFENGEFAGEGLTDPIHAGEKRLLSYAIDQAVHISTEGDRDETRLRHIAIHDGTLIEGTDETRETTYVIHNAAAEARTVILEHPVEEDWKLTSDTKPIETTSSDYRFRVEAQPGEIARVRVAEKTTSQTGFALVAVDDAQLQVILSGNGNIPALTQALAPVLAARARVHDLDVQTNAKQKEIERAEADSTRLHTNIQGLKDSPEERDLARRYAGEMNADEDQLQSLRKDLASLQQQRTAAAQSLNGAIRNLNLDQDI
jgi:hypothetical protein